MGLLLRLLRTWRLRQRLIAGRGGLHCTLNDPLQPFDHSVPLRQQRLLLEHLRPQRCGELLQAPELDCHALVVASQLLEQLLNVLVLAFFFLVRRLRGRFLFARPWPACLLQGLDLGEQPAVFILQSQELLLLLFKCYLALPEVVILHLVQQLKIMVLGQHRLVL